jgi:hypothetical protein
VAATPIGKEVVVGLIRKRAGKCNALLLASRKLTGRIALASG